MLKLEHIGIAVKSLSDSILVFEALLNTGCYKEEVVETESVRTAFFAIGDHKVELLESTDPDDYFLTTTFAATPAIRAKLRLRLLELIRTLAGEVEKVDATDVYHLNIDLFRI